ncbi:MAG TPA: BatA and WFA domain-containing protein [Longimicrobiales bacterium]|nr:BatA and WFA domain-containing protein [Longimicrobiales bacterium]
MGALNPLFLLAGAAVAVPLFLHLFQRQEARRVAFPALRYLERTEREHARRIRFRQLLLLMLRAGAVLAVVAAGAGLFVRGSGSAHPPTALAIVLDNSMSSGLVVGEARVLDRLKDLARSTLADATDQDRIWVVLAGEPWIPSAPGGPEEARRVIEGARTSAGAGDLHAALSRAAELVSASGLQAREIHLLSDLQASGFAAGADEPAGDVPVVVWAPDGAPGRNHAILSLLVGGGMAPLEGQRYEVTVSTAPAADREDTAAAPVRIVVEGRVRSAAALPPGASLSLLLPPAPAGWTTGWAESDPDALNADDRRYFAFPARPAPGVALDGDVGVFVAEAVAVLDAGGRLRVVPPREADLVVSQSAGALGTATVSSAVLVLPPADPTLLPALNRRLAAAGIPWRLERLEGEGEVTLDGATLPDPLRGVRARRWYRLSLNGDPPTPTRTLALAGGDPWAVDGTDTSGRRYLILASPLDAEATSLPVSAAMVRMVDWAAVAWAGAGAAAVEHPAGSALSAPRDADAVRLPSGVEIPLDGTRMVRATGEPGIYTFLAGDRLVAHEAVNPDAAESDLTAVDPARLRRALGSQVTSVATEGGWRRAIFRARQGPELGRTLVAAVLVILLLEAAVAATGRLAGRGRAVVEGGHGPS